MSEYRDAPGEMKICEGCDGPRTTTVGIDHCLGCLRGSGPEVKKHRQAVLSLLRLQPHLEAREQRLGGPER